MKQEKYDDLLISLFEASCLLKKENDSGVMPIEPRATRAFLYRDLDRLINQLKRDSLAIITK